MGCRALPHCVTRGDAVPTAGACGLARAPGWIDSASITRHMSGVGQMRVVPHGGRTLMLVDHATLLDAVERAEPRHALPFLRWLDLHRARLGAARPARR